MAKGGGVSGAVSFPNYQSDVHGDWLGNESVAAPDTAIDINVVEAMNTILGSGPPGARSTAVIVAIPANDIVNDEGFTLVNNANVSKVYKFKVESGEVTGEDYIVQIYDDDTATEVATAINTYINASGWFVAERSEAVVTVTQLLVGTSGNRANSDTVTDVDFTLSAFTGGINAGSATQNPYSAAEAYDPASDIDDILSDLATYKAFVETLNPEGLVGSHIDTALTLASDTNFPVLSISDAVGAIVTSAITDAASAATDARQKAGTDTDMMINSASVAAISIIDSTPVADMIEQFGQRAEVAHLKAMNRFAGGMAEVNAVQGSAFLFGLALLEAEHTEKVDEFIAQLSLRIFEIIVPAYLQTRMASSAEQLRVFRECAITEIRNQTAATMLVRQNKDAFLTTAVNDLANMVSQQMAGKHSVVATGAEAQRIKFVALSERDKQDLLYDVEEWLWELKLFQYGSNVLSGISGGGQVLPESPSQMQTTLGGAFTGAALGAGIGVTPMQKGIGAIAGGVLGGIGGYFEGS